MLTLKWNICFEIIVVFLTYQRVITGRGKCLL